MMLAPGRLSAGAMPPKCIAEELQKIAFDQWIIRD